MPIYVYKCKECGEIFEKIVSISAAGKAQVCPKCDSAQTEKQVAAVNSFGGGRESGASASSSSCGGGGRFT